MEMLEARPIDKKKFTEDMDVESEIRMVKDSKSCGQL